MIINANGVNVDTNTQRTDSEIRSLIATNTSNMMTRTLLKTLNVNQTVNQTPWNVSFGTFTLSDNDVLLYNQLIVEFTGTLQAIASSTEGGLYLEIVSGSDKVSVADVRAYANYPNTLNGFSTILRGGYITKTRISSGATTVSRPYSVGTSSASILMNGSQLSFKLSGVNNIGTASINGTINIYGIK